MSMQKDLAFAKSYLYLKQEVKLSGLRREISITGQKTFIQVTSFSLPGFGFQSKTALNPGK
jgi:hypothetical protein